MKTPEQWIEEITEDLCSPHSLSCECNRCNSGYEAFLLPEDIAAIQTDARADLIQAKADLDAFCRELDTDNPVTAMADLQLLKKRYSQLRHALWKYVSDHTGSAQLESEIDEIVHEAGEERVKFQDMFNKAVGLSSENHTRLLDAEQRLEWLVSAIRKTLVRFEGIEVDILSSIANPPDSKYPELTEAKLKARRQTIQHTLLSLRWLIGQHRPWMKSKHDKLALPA